MWLAGVGRTKLIGRGDDANPRRMERQKKRLSLNEALRVSSLLATIKHFRLSFRFDSARIS